MHASAARTTNSSFFRSHPPPDRPTENAGRRQCAVPWQQRQQQTTKQAKQATSKVNSITFVQYLHKQPKQNNMSYGGGYGGRYVT
jgi:hypothetical protein